LLCMGGQLSLLKELTNLHYNFCQCFHVANFTNFFVGTAGVRVELLQCSSHSVL